MAVLLAIEGLLVVCNLKLASVLFVSTLDKVGGIWKRRDRWIWLKNNWDMKIGKCVISRWRKQFKVDTRDDKEGWTKSNYDRGGTECVDVSQRLITFIRKYWAESTVIAADTRLRIHYYVSNYFTVDYWKYCIKITEYEAFYATLRRE